jgi:segregation and condensation protein B
MSFDRSLLRRVVEGALLAAGEPLNRDKLLSLFPEDEVQPEKEDLMAVIEDIQADYKDRGFELKQVASGWRFQVVEEVAPWVNRLWEEKPQKYSRAMLETLALIAYRQPITRGDIEEIRGVAVSSHIIKTLSERDWIKVVGHRDVPGRPSLYATTRQFLDYFNLKSLEELPSLNELADIEKLNQELDFETDQKLQAEGVNPEQSDSDSAPVAESAAADEVEEADDKTEEAADDGSVSLAQALAEEALAEEAEQDEPEQQQTEKQQAEQDQAEQEDIEGIVDESAEDDQQEADDSHTEDDNGEEGSETDWSSHKSSSSLFDA